MIINELPNDVLTFPEADLIPFKCLNLHKILGLKTILLFGAGKSATTLIDYLVSAAASNDWNSVIADTNEDLIISKTKHASSTKAVVADITNEIQRKELIRNADLVISMMPPSLHMLIARDCLSYGKHLLTASYVDDSLRQLAPAVKEKGILFLCEMGLDPGIDHMSAMKIIHEIKEAGGKINSFKSHCGGLVAPESDDNPWHYKISWNPRNIVMAGKSGAVYKLNGKEHHEQYAGLFQPGRTVYVNEELGSLAWYPNRDSLSYIDLYDLHDAETFIRTTLRHPDFIYGWNKLIGLQLTAEEKKYETGSLSLAGFYEQHFNSVHFKLPGDQDPLKAQMLCLGLEDHETLINKGSSSAMDVLQFAMERKLALKPSDRDMIVMLHEFEYTLHGRSMKAESTLVVKGDDSLHTAMAKTVGLPLGIAAKLILDGTIAETGLHIPVSPAIYEPALKELAGYGIAFVEKNEEM